MRRLCLLALSVSLISAAAIADTIPTFTLTSGTISAFQRFNGGTTSVDYFLSGPGGVSVEGGSTMGAFCGFVVGGSQCVPSASTSPNEPGDNAFATFGGNSFGPLRSLGGVTVSGQPIALPQSVQSTFNITVPVLFSGAFSVCPLQPGFQGGCVSPSIASFNVNGTGTGQLQFILLSVLQGVPIWQLSSATFTLSPVSEPSSIMLFGTGALALFGRLLRRKN